ncbi:MAG: type II toxin-antitoxin system mRNA interferase toxin, RelE/StbE family [Proteobacteria bacterium]|nr:type II toxin-antitoxin system mRNA interferase toxin, RelE/StbE family [Pseudomonadota bacterium]
MWRIYEHKDLVSQKRRLPLEIRKKYEKWKDIVSISGPQGLRLIRGFRDKALRGDWKGFRSSRLSTQYRIIYKIEKDMILIKVMRISAHDYAR